MSEAKLVGNLIKTVLILFMVLVFFVVGSVTGNELINGDDYMMVSFGFGIYLLVGIVEILLGYTLFKTWRS